MSSGDTVDIAAVQGSEHGDGSVPAGTELLHFTEASATGDDSALAQARSQLVDAIGQAAMIDTAGIISAFQMMNRIANATGTPLDAPLVAQTEALLPQIGVQSFASAPEESQP